MDNGIGKTARKLSLAVVVLAALVLAMGMPGQASAAQTCAGIGGTDVGGDCTISTPVTAFCPIDLDVPGDLLITGTGRITCNDPISAGDPGASSITISVGGDMEMQGGSSIRAENLLGGGNGGKIMLTVDGSFVMRSGAVISSSNSGSATGVAGDIRIQVGNVLVNPDDTIQCATTPAGDIVMENGAKILANAVDEAGSIKMFAGKNATINGLVSSEGTSTNGRGGPITIDACCDLVVGDTGQVISRGKDAGADLVHLQACVVKIWGLVESSGAGHKLPLDNLCNVNRPGKPANSAACVEIWAGTTLEIDSTNGHKGEVNADTGQSGGIEGRSWVDVLANLAITIRGNGTAPAAGNNDTNPAFAVHANQFLGGHGGDITVISTGSTVTMFGRALQANSSTNVQSSGGGAGGHLVIRAHDAVAFGTGAVPAYAQAAGDANGAGGTVLAKSYNGDVTGVAGSQINAGGPGGLVTLEGCTDPILTYLGTVIATTYNHMPVCPGGSPPLPVPANTLIPSADCATRCGGLPAGNKSGVKFHDLNGNHKQDAGEPGLIGWTIHVFDRVSKALVASTVTVAANPLSIPPTPDGFYSFTLPVGDYTACEALQTGWTQTAPSGFFPVPAGETLADCTTYTNGGTITPGPTGYNFTIVGAEVHANNDFGNVMQGRGTCLKFPNLVTTNTFNLNSDPTQIQKIIDAAHAGDVILLLPQNGVKTESITINKRIQLIGCSTTLNSATVGAPVVTITSGANGGVTKDVHATGSTVAGYKIEGSNHTIANVRAFKNAIGFWITSTGSFNTVTGALGTLGNGTGVRIDGSNNLLDTNNGVQDSTGDGVVISAGATLNTVKKYTVKGSGGNGFKVEAGATLNTLSENKAYSNGLNGYMILGNDTKMSKNIAGDTGTGNAGDGIRVDGSNGDIWENTSKSNALVGIRVTGTGHNLKKNKSGGTVNQNNGSCQYVVAASNSNGGSNTASNNATFTFTSAGANSPAGCLPAPPTP
jgi:hypothetical protein